MSGVAWRGDQERDADAGTWHGGVVAEQRLGELMQLARGVGIDMEAGAQEDGAQTQGEGRGGG